MWSFPFHLSAAPHPPAAAVWRPAVYLQCCHVDLLLQGSASLLLFSQGHRHDHCSQLHLLSKFFKIAIAIRFTAIQELWTEMLHYTFKVFCEWNYSFNVNLCLCVQAILGRVIFGETQATLWWVGISITLCGLLVLHGSSQALSQEEEEDKDKWCCFGSSQTCTHSPSITATCGKASSSSTFRHWKRNVSYKRGMKVSC